MLPHTTASPNRGRKATDAGRPTAEPVPNPPQDTLPLWSLEPDPTWDLFNEFPFEPDLLTDPFGIFGPPSMPDESVIEPALRSGAAEAVARAEAMASETAPEILPGTAPQTVPVAPPLHRDPRERCAEAGALVRDAIQTLRCPPSRNQGIQLLRSCQTLGEVAELIRRSQVGGHRKVGLGHALLRTHVAFHLPVKLAKAGHAEAAGLVAVLVLQCRPGSADLARWIKALDFLPQRYPAEVMAGYPALLAGVEDFMNQLVAGHTSGRRPLEPGELVTLKAAIRTVQGYTAFLSGWRPIDPHTGGVAAMPADDRRLPADLRAKLVEPLKRTHTETVTSAPAKKQRLEAIADPAAIGLHRPAQAQPAGSASGLSVTRLEPRGVIQWQVHERSARRIGDPVIQLTFPSDVSPPNTRPVGGQEDSTRVGERAGGLVPLAQALMAAQGPLTGRLDPPALSALRFLAQGPSEQQVRSTMATHPGSYGHLLQCLLRLPLGLYDSEPLTTELALLLLEDNPAVGQSKALPSILHALAIAPALPRGRPLRPGLLVSLSLQNATEALMALEALMSRSV